MVIYYKDHTKKLKMIENFIIYLVLWQYNIKTEKIK